MRTSSIIIALVLMAGSALAQENATPRKFTQEPARTTVAKESGEVATEQLAKTSQLALRTAMNDEIAQRVVVEQNAVAALAARLDGAVTSEARLALNLQITEIKQKGSRDLLAIQLKYAELGGHTEQAEELRQRVAQLDEGLSPQRTAPTTTRRSADTSRKGGE